MSEKEIYETNSSVSGSPLMRHVPKSTNRNSNPLMADLIIREDLAEWIQRTYPRLHELATGQMRNERVGHTLSATSLIHEVFIRLGSDNQLNCSNERQFLGIVASEMRRVLVDAARRKKSLRSGGKHNKVALTNEEPARTLAKSVIDLNEAIKQFEIHHPEKAELVKLRYILGLTEQDAANSLGISRATASRYWNFSRAWLLDYLS